MSDLSIDISSDKMQQKLRAIAKHVEALADELQEIDRLTCPECGSDNVDCLTAYGDMGEIISMYECRECDRGFTLGVDK